MIPPSMIFQFDMFLGVVVGRDVNAERYNVRIKVSSPWFLVNVLTQKQQARFFN
jgi:hypothetical protein